VEIQETTSNSNSTIQSCNKAIKIYIELASVTTIVFHKAARTIITLQARKIYYHLL